MSDELKPCPFCGKQFEIQWHGMGYQLIHESEDCILQTQNGQGWTYGNKNKLARMVNTRPVEDALRSELAAANQRAERPEHFAAGRGSVSEAADMQEGAVLVVGLQDRAEQAEAQTIAHLMGEAKRISTEHGWWATDRNDGEMIALMHSELSEALEALRHGNPPSDHTPDFSGVEEEMADVIIRVLDYAAARGLRLGEALVAKMKFNETREFKHGGKKF